ncbi:MAG: tetratricopeptide repeat protein [Betaproteobacteria bacterium]|nr:MAG: tetratricopeptide repeat protein [Betaproteobacteria bacterium]
MRAFIRRRRTQRGKTSAFRLSCFVIVALLLIPVPWQPVRAAADGELAAERGIAAFRAGDYPAALQSFLDALRAGLDTPGLHYDLGATYYRLGRYEEAEREFQALAPDPKWAPLARYNLGLSAQRAGRPQQAMEYFGEAHRTTADPNLRALAATAFERLRGAPPSPQTSAVISLAGGYDSNATLSPDAATVGVSHQGDRFVEALAAATHRLAGNTERGWVAHGGLVLRKYADLSQFDVRGSRAGLSYETDSGRAQTSVGGYFETAYIGGDRLQQVASVDAQASWRLDAGGELRGRYQFGHIAGGGGFEYLDGRQQRLSADAGFALASALLRVGYQLELNDRRDLQQGSEFFSASPTRHSLFASVALRNLAGWQADARGEYRVSRYRDPNLIDGGAQGILEVTRRDQRYGFALRASRPVAAPWRVFIDYSYYRNESNLDTYDYSRHQLMAGIEASLEK